MIKTVKIVSASDPNFEQLRQQGKLVCGADVEFQMRNIKARFYARKKPQIKLRENHGVLDANSPLEAFEKNSLLSALGYIDSHFPQGIKSEHKGRVFVHPMGCYPDLWLLQSHKINQWHQRIAESKTRIFEVHPNAQKIKQRMKVYATQQPNLRLVFSKVTDDDGEHFYRFLGLYRPNIAVSDKTWGVVWQQQQPYFRLEIGEVK